MFRQVAYAPGYPQSFRRPEGQYRTPHVLAVITALISQYGRQPGHADLADRYLNHAHIDQYRQAEHR